MRRFLLLTIVSLVVPLVLYQPAIRTQENYEDHEGGLPNLSDYPKARSTCFNRKKLEPWVGTPSVSPNMARCLLHVTVCGGKVKKYRSEPRQEGPTLCADFWEMHAELGKRTICCDLVSPEDFPEARGNCKNKQRLVADRVTRVPATGDKIMCQFSTRVCGRTKVHESLDERANTPNACIDFEAASARLSGLMVCCDAPEETPPCADYSGEISCDCNGDGQDEISKEFKSCGVPNQWPANFKSKCQDWVRPDGSIGYGTDIGIQRQASAWLEYTLKCPALKCEQEFKPCKQDADNDYEQCLTRANLTGWRERCLANYERATKRCQDARNQCLTRARGSRASPTPPSQ